MLAIMIGPITFALVQVSVERGMRAGLLVGLGVWISDLLFIAGVYFGLSRVSALTAYRDFELTLGLAGGVLLFAFGVGTLWSSFRGVSSLQKAIALPVHPLLLATKGFLINTVNPFTVFFWIGVISKVLVEDGIAGSGALLYLGGMIGTISLTDALKVFTARSLRSWLTLEHILLLRRISAIALMLFGVILVIRVM